MRSYTTRTIGKWILGLVMICLMIGSGALDVFAASYDDSVDMVLQYRQTYTADANRTNDTFQYQIVPVDGAPAPNEKYFSVKGEPGKTTRGEVALSMVFPRPGEYKYKVSAYVPNPQSGFTYESGTYTLHVYVQNDDNGGLKMATVSGENGYKNGIVDFNVKYEAEKVPGTDVRPTTTPTGDGNPAPARRRANAAAPGAPAVPDGETIEPEPTPLENIINDVVPKADPDRAYWALINLLAAIATVITSAILVVRFLERIDTEEDEYIIRRKGNIRLVGLLPAIASVITFVLTENMSLPMELTDEWTPFMLVVLVIELIVAFVVYMKYDRENDEEEAAA